MKRMVVLCILLLTANAAERVTVRQLFSVQTVQVKAQRAASKQTNYGFVKADESRIYDVVPRFGGYVETLYADTRYRRVAKGEPLAVVYSPDVLQAKEDYLNSLKFDTAHGDAAMLRSARARLELLGVAPEEIRAVKTQKKAGRFTTIYAPASGWIFEKSIRSGSAFMAGKMLFQIVNLDRVWVEAELYQKALPQLASLKRFTVKATGVDTPFAATKALFYPDIDPKSATATLRLEVANPDALLVPGMYVTVTSAAPERRSLTLPRTAVIRKAGGWYVFLAGEFKGEYEPLKIDVRPLDAARYEVVSGLREGDAVVDNALFMMDADAQINGLY